MVARKAIEDNLTDLDHLFNQASSTKKKIMYSKMAVIELCGWIEMTFDEIARVNSNRLLKEAKNRNIIKDAIKKNYGFDYKDNVKPMFIKIVGLRTIERLEKKLERTGKITILSTELGNLKSSRNSAAHTYVKGTTLTYSAPSITKAAFSVLYPLIREFDIELRKYW